MRNMRKAWLLLALAGGVILGVGGCNNKDDDAPATKTGATPSLSVPGAGDTSDSGGLVVSALEAYNLPDGARVRLHGTIGARNEIIDQSKSCTTKTTPRNFAATTRSLYHDYCTLQESKPATQDPNTGVVTPGSNTYQCCQAYYVYPFSDSSGGTIMLDFGAQTSYRGAATVIGTVDKQEHNNGGTLEVNVIAVTP